MNVFYMVIIVMKGLCDEFGDLDNQPLSSKTKLVEQFDMTTNLVGIPGIKKAKNITYSP